MKYPMIDARKLMLFIASSGVALALAMFFIEWKPAHAAVPGSAGDGVVNPAFGSYGDSIEIEVPDYYDLEPKLKLVYSSGNGNDIAGMGWGISIDSFIERISPGGGAPVYNSTDKFHMDGAELLPSTSLGGSHVTKQQSYLRIQQDVVGNTWSVWDKEGNKSTYAPLYLVQLAVGQSPVTFRWALSTVEDTNGNTVIYNYWSDGSQNSYLDNVTYNGHTIKFWRETRPDPISFANGASVGHTNFRLKTIEVKAGANRIRAYKLAYKVSTNTQRSLLQSVQEFGSDVTIDGTGTVISGTSLPAQSMTYTAGGVGYPRTIRRNRDIGGWNLTVQEHNADVNGDGKEDHIRIWNDAGQARAQVNLSDGKEFPITNTNAVIGGWNTKNKDNFIDVNGDGKADLVQIWDSAGRAKAKVMLSNGTGFPAETSNIEIGAWNDIFLDYFADVNGDGRTDLIRVWKSGEQAMAQVNLSNGTGYPVKNFNAAIGSWNADYKNYFVDVNGDGKADLIRIWNTGNGAKAQVNLSNGTGFPVQHSNFAIGGWNPTTKDFFVDANGDGKADLVRIWNNDGKGKAQLSLSTGIGFPAVSSRSDIGGWSTTTSDYLADLNGDGSPDIIRVWDSNGSAFAETYLFDGVGYGPRATNQLVGTFNINWRDSFADVDGDGRADFVRIWNNDSRAWAQVDLAADVGGTTPPDLMTSITNGVGGSTTIKYAPSSDWPSKFAPRGGNFPTVETIAVNDGRGKSGTTTYSYADAQHSLVDKAFLGFRLQEAVVDDLGTYVETFNRQTPQSVGEAEAIYTRNNSGQIYGYTTYTYSESGNGITTPYTSQVSASSEFEVNLGTGGRETRTSYTYDPYGNQTQIIYEGDVAVAGDEFVKTIAYVYNPSIYLMDVEQSEQKYAGTSVVPANKVDESIYYYDGATSTFALPTKGNLTRTDSWNNQTGGYVSATGIFDSYGNQTSSTDTRGVTSTTLYDPVYHQYPIQSTNALGHVTTCVWDYVKGVALSTIDENGAITLYGYDALSRPTSLTDAAGNITTTEYLNVGDPNNHRVRKTTPDDSADGLWTETYSDGLGRVYKSVREGASAGVTYIKEAVFNDADQHPQQVSLWYQSGSTPKWETYQYDGVGRMLRTTHADGSFATLAYGLDTAGKPFTTMTDELGHQRSIWIDTAEQVIRVMEKNGTLFYNTYRSYDVEGRLIKIQDTANNITTYTYNSLGQNIATSDMNLGLVTNTFDAGGAVLTETDAKGQTTSFTYDALGRLKTKTAGGETTTWYYDEAGYGTSLGELTRVVYPAGSEAFSYNRLGQVTTATKTIGAISKTIANTYDSVGRIKTLTYPDGEVVSYGYGADGALYSVGGYVDAMVYGPNGELIQLTYANGTTSSFDYDPNRLWLNTANVKNGATVLYAGAYTYNANQLVTSMTHGTPTPQTTVYAYDELGRLLSVDGAQTQSFTYDAVGNMMSNSLKGAYDYSDSNHRHAVTRAGSSSYTYDANGNMQTGNGKQFSWDADDRLSSVTQGTAVTAFAYGAGHDRVMKTKGPNTTLYFSGLIEQLNGSPTQYIYAASILVAKKDSAGTKTWYHADRLGSIRLMTNDVGAEVKDYDYRPFGEVLTTSGTVANERGFTGQIADAETGLMYYNARYYDATLGRFISADTMVQDEDDPQDLNAYSYCSNNPVNYNDPTGHIRVFAGMMRYVTWSKRTVSRSITVKVPYVIVYPTFSFYWRTVSVSKTLTWWFFGWRHKTVSVSVPVPVVRITWHVKTGYHTYHRTIRFLVSVPHVHFKAIYRNVVTAAKKIHHKAQHAYRAVKKGVTRASRHVASAAKATGRFIKKHQRTIVTVVAVVAVVAAVAATGGAAGVLVGAGLGARAAAGGVNAGAAVVFGVMNGKSAGAIAKDAAIQGALGFASAGIANRISTVAKGAQLGKKSTIAANFGGNMGFSFGKDTINNYAGGKSPGESLEAAGKGAILGSVLTGGILASPGGFQNAKSVGAASVIGNIGGQIFRQ